MPTIEEIIKRAKGYMPDVDLAPLQEAYTYAKKIYSDKKRLSDEPYISHALAVADILASMRLDIHTLMAGLLHGVLKKSGTTSSEAELQKLFGKDVASIVNGTTKITEVQFNSKIAYHAENIRKMLLAMSADIRVMMVKLADRFHDIQTLQYVPKENQQEFAKETLDLYAPLASRLGIDWMKRELEDLAFSYIHPEDFADLSHNIKSSVQDRQTYVDEVISILQKELTKYGLQNFQILGRPKHLYSIYKKLLAQNIPVEKVYDKVAFRIIVHTVKECYEALGVIHALWHPIDGRFKDFISTPKSNMYQSLHTSVVGPRGEFMEIQIRTEEMDKIAKEGIAAHWAYKEGKAITSKDAKLFQWLKQWVGSLQDLKEPKEFLDAVKSELYEADVFVLTPNGEVKQLPLGSTPLDFAYNIHTEVGNRCVGAKINGLIAPLKTRLKNGDQIEIITSSNQTPSRGWLALVKTARARSRIRSWLNREEQEKSLKVGREICERELRKHSISLKKFIKTGHLKEVLKALSCNSLEDLLSKVGHGKVTVDAIVRELQPEEIREEKPPVVEAIPTKRTKKSVSEDAIVVEGTSGVLTRISNCCMPVPGDDITGFITSGHGISIHKSACPNLLASDPHRLIEVSWASDDVKSTHRAQIHVIAQDQKGLLADLSNVISTDDANILNIEANTSTGNLARINIILEVTSLSHLTTLLQHIQQIDGILEAKRK